MRIFFFWGYDSNYVYMKSWTLNDLKTAIREKIEEIDLKCLNLVKADFGKILRTQRYYLPYTIFLNNVSFYTNKNIPNYVKKKKLEINGIQLVSKKAYSRAMPSIKSVTPFSAGVAIKRCSG